FVFVSRESAKPMIPQGNPSNKVDPLVDWDNPPPLNPGNAAVRLDPRGRLVGFYVVPSATPNSPPTPETTDWAKPLLAAAELDVERFQSTNVQWVPMVVSDRQVAWLGTRADSPDVTVRVEAAPHRGKPGGVRLDSAG